MVVSDFRSPLACARGAGSAHSGAATAKKHHQAFYALVPLALYALVTFFADVGFKGGDYAHALAWLKAPLNALDVMLFLVVASYYGVGDLLDILEDYWRGGRKCFAAFVVKFGGVLCASAGVLAVLKVFLGA